MNRNTLAIGSMVIACVAVLAAFTSRRPAPPTAVIAVVNLENALKGLNERTTKEAELRTRLDEMQKKITDMETNIKEENENMKLMPEGPDRRAALERLRRLAYSYEFEKGFSQRALTELEGEMLRELYLKIDETAERLAKRNGYTMVLASDESVTVPAGNPQDIMRTVSLKRMLFVDPAHDVTAELITMMNNEYAARPGGKK